MATKKIRDRQKISLRRIQNQDDMYATFSKRRLGIYKKASELSTLCGVDIGVIIFSPTNNPFSFFSPSMEYVVDRYQNPNQPINVFTRLIKAQSQAQIEQLNHKLDEVLQTKAQLKEREKYEDEIDKARPKGWWEQVPVESLNLQQVKEWTEWFQNLRAQVSIRIEARNRWMSSSAFQQQNAYNFPSLGPDTSLPSLDAPGPSSYTQVLGGSNQFLGQHYDVALHGQYPVNGSNTGHITTAFQCLPEPSSQVYDPYGEELVQIPSQYLHVPCPLGQARNASNSVEDGGSSYCVFPGGSSSSSQAQHPNVGGENAGFSSGHCPRLAWPCQGLEEFLEGQIGLFPPQGGLGSGIGVDRVGM